jgi:hypothetical protein
MTVAAIWSRRPRVSGQKTSSARCDDLSLSLAGAVGKSRASYGFGAQTVRCAAVLVLVARSTVLARARASTNINDQVAEPGSHRRTCADDTLTTTVRSAGSRCWQALC